MEQTPDAPADLWNFQGTLPVREAHYSLQLPNGWSYKATWLNHAEESPLSTGANQWRWALENLAAVRVEPRMPPLGGVAGSMYVTLLAPPGQRRSMETWSDIGAWSAVWEAQVRDGADNAVRGPAILDDVEGCLVFTEGPQIAACGIRDLVIVATPERVLIVPRDQDQRVRKLAERAGGG